jgi:lysozyme family protein
MDFDQAFDRLMGHEGGYVNLSSDPGGETQWGISKRSYPQIDIKALTRDEAKEIYRRDFWDRIHADEMYDGVAFQALDFAINSGIQTSIRKLQKAIGVADDGHWGAVTQAAIASMSESDVIMRFVAERLDFWSSLSTWASFGKGWARRAAQNLRYGAEDS